MERRRFSAALQGQNLRFTGAGEGGSARARVGFLLLEHFSLPAFTQALDTLVTANLIRSESFAVSNFSLSGEPVTSDLGLLICPDLALASAERQGLDLLVVCGGLRTPLRSSAALREALQDVASRGVALAGLWNGAWFLGDAGLLDGYRCCIHPEHRAALAEIARNSQVTSDSYMVDRDRLTAASPTGAFNLALEWIARRHGRDLVEAVVDILAFEESRYRRVRPALHEKMSEPLREVINLMAANIEEPLSQEQLAHYVGRSRRQIERLFQQQLGTTPVRYYLELRITECRRLLQHSDLTMLEVLVACGFVSPSHFSKCYTAFYGYPPSKEMRYGNVRSTK
ncbi:GlxA family transcriptional regulator [Pseudomonas aeruginosa]|uniref:GlxA family transcriptional regulator n=2 Tax=Pseudomonas aeruginosa TaxID=287 RepID=UPI00046664F7|nr:GlxA family transcriptional regulator [Pseudomonas aeruginosa]EKV4570126.1 GlxA family transcriptional regulator [Pseudomonas aeruginosa]KSD39577.1 AraC family transcriptional regulator [Pseudomonas aeruginosa]MBH8874061.1 GlxA family transcriptional regulator [Pseudomonas aeruginosa]MBI8971033.1 GlxA family transcriptional regulator [Pseudomonas aeruginosa]MBU8394267.1 GlxA family transcriptional regulator [Pseudomonas aeruginosa]